MILSVFRSGEQLQTKFELVVVAPPTPHIDIQQAGNSRFFYLKYEINESEQNENEQNRRKKN